MPTDDKRLAVLKSELDFLDHGGYRSSVGARQPLFCMESEPAWHKPLFFEDSPSCPKHKYEKCVPEHNCVLMDFVPEASRNESVPCRHIPLNEKHETVEMLAKCGRGKDVEPALRTWLVKTIGELESAAVH